LLAFACVASACSSDATLAVDATSPVVSSVIDGDTVIVEFSDGTEEIVRLLGVDTPETVDRNRPVQCFGAEASTYVATLLPPGTELRLERDVEARDHFGRLLAYIYRRSDDLFINRELLRLGFADLSIYPPNDTYATDLQAVTTSARTQALGLWSACGGPDAPLDPPGR
jgi:micrococcal nuclease